MAEMFKYFLDTNPDFRDYACIAVVLYALTALGMTAYFVFTAPKVDKNQDTDTHND